ncbi:MAG: FadR/GntR family transcriptional regulator [Ferrovibrio sp.]|uniref:FadR/GntR family transcriptional regulator n=1 Tax=Ferrovibrio sp. TaxID=1917215 RepID=UPI0039197D44
MTFTKLDILPAYKLVSRRIEQHILEGRLQPGDRLPSEPQLAAQFGVNRATVREGIRQLEQEGFLQRAAGRRLFVSLPGYNDLAPRASRALAMQKVSFRELWDVAILLEPPAARRAAEVASEADIAALEENVIATEAAVDAGRPFTQLDTEFHAMVARISGNRVLELSREAVGLLFYPALEALLPHLPQAGRRNVIGHRKVLEAIRRRDADEAELWMRKQMIDFRRGYELAGLDMDAPVAWTEHARSGEAPDQ